MKEVEAAWIQRGSVLVVDGQELLVTTVDHGSAGKLAVRVEGRDEPLTFGAGDTVLMTNPSSLAYIWRLDRD